MPLSAYLRISRSSVAQITSPEPADAEIALSQGMFGPVCQEPLTPASCGNEARYADG
jgi:hypothetical protein